MSHEKVDEGRGVTSAGKEIDQWVLITGEQHKLFDFD